MGRGVMEVVRGARCDREVVGVFRFRLEVTLR